jgi:hypothetical protein
MSLQTEQKIWHTLTHARSLLAAGWTQEVYARNARGEAVALEDPTACQFCLSGALYRCLQAEDPETQDELVHLSLKRLTRQVLARHSPLADPPQIVSAVTYNDHATSVKEILDLVDEALWETERRLAALREK